MRWFGQSLVVAGGLVALPVRAQDETSPCQRVSGAGSYRIGPFDPVEADGEPAYLVTDLGFDETMVFCKVTTNFQPFRFPTASMGTIAFQPHQFGMDMRSSLISSLKVEETERGLIAVYEGLMRSTTWVFNAEEGAMTEIVEDAIAFGCRAGMSDESVIEITPHSFSMTAHFNPNLAHAAIFGEEAVFAGPLQQGSIVIVA
jgi:hypothetical protein